VKRNERSLCEPQSEAAIKEDAPCTDDGSIWTMDIKDVWQSYLKPRTL